MSASITATFPIEDETFTEEDLLAEAVTRVRSEAYLRHFTGLQWENLTHRFYQRPDGTGILSITVPCNDHDQRTSFIIS
ncbi:hypothetical protein [Arcanobacterium canis]